MADFFPPKLKEWSPEKLSITDKDGKLVGPDKLQNTFDRLIEHLQRLASVIFTSHEEHDLTFDGITSPLAIIHGLGRVPSSCEVVWCDRQAVVYAAASVGWGSKVVHVAATQACHARIRLR